MTLENIYVNSSDSLYLNIISNLKKKDTKMFY